MFDRYPIKYCLPNEPRKKSQLHFLEWNGKTQTINAWANELGINSGTILGRIKSGWTIEAALTTRPIPRNETGKRKSQHPQRYTMMRFE